ncbi:unnamed protein product [Effrenium voratum]|nr:unnamed protein product [Effrenium voratum]
MARSEAEVHLLSPIHAPTIGLNSTSPAPWLGPINSEVSNLQLAGMQCVPAAVQTEETFGASERRTKWGAQKMAALAEETCWPASTETMVSSDGIKPGRVKSRIDELLREQRRARREASMRLLKFLEKNGFRADVNCRRASTWGFSYTYPLHEAAKQNDTYALRWLLRFGADPGKKDASGRTALDVLKPSSAHKEACRILEKEGDRSLPLLRGFRQFMAALEKDPIVCQVKSRLNTSAR